MKTLTVRLPEALVAEIEAESRERRISKSDVVRERPQHAVGPAQRPAALLDAIADLIGSVDGLPADLSTRKKRYFKTTGYAGNVLLDAGFVVPLLSRRDSHHHWAVSQTPCLAHLGAPAKPFCRRPSIF